MRRTLMVTIFLMLLIAMVFLSYKVLLPFIVYKPSGNIYVVDSLTYEKVIGASVTIMINETSFHYLGDVANVDYLKGMDGKIDDRDVLLMQNAWSPGYYDEWYDLNKDGKIDGADASILSANLGANIMNTIKTLITDNYGKVNFGDVLMDDREYTQCYKVNVSRTPDVPLQTFLINIKNGASLYVNVKKFPVINSLTATSTVLPFEPNISITFTADAYDPDGTITKYLWDFQSDGVIDKQTTVKTVEYAYSKYGTYTVNVTVIDNDNFSAKKQLTINVKSKPIAKINAPSVAKVGDNVKFDGSASYDPDGGSITSYNWNFGDGATSTGSQVTHVYNSGGTFTVTLTVIDDDNQQGISSTTISVTVVPGYAEFSYTPAVPYKEEIVTFDASASSPSSGATITDYSWNFGDGSTASGKIVTHSFLTIQTFTVSLTITDSNNNQYSITKNVEVIPTLTADFTYSGELTVNKPVLFVSTSTGKITSYTWYVDGVNIGTGESISYIFTSSGSHTVQLSVTDVRGSSKYALKTVSVSGEAPYITLLTLLEFPPSTNVQVQLKATSPSSGKPLSGITLSLTILPNSNAGWSGSTASGATDVNGLTTITILTPPSSLYTYNTTVTFENKVLAYYELKILPQILIKVVSFDYEQTYKPGDYDFSYTGTTVDKETGNIISDASPTSKILTDDTGKVIDTSYTSWSATAGTFTFKAKIFDFYKAINPDFNYQQHTLTLTIVFNKAGYISAILNVTAKMSAPSVIAMISSNNLIVGESSIKISFKDKYGSPYEGLTINNIEVVITDPVGVSKSTRIELQNNVYFDSATKTVTIAYTFDIKGVYKITVKYYGLPFTQEQQTFSVNVTEAPIIPPILTNPYVLGIIGLIVLFVLFRRRKSNET